MVDVYHHLTKPAEFLAAIGKYLKPDGRLVVAAIVHKHAPDLRSRTHDPCVSDPDETRKAIEKAGYVFLTLVIHEDPKARFFPDSYVLVFSAASPQGTARGGAGGAGTASRSLTSVANAALDLTESLKQFVQRPDSLPG